MLTMTTRTPPVATMMLMKLVTQHMLNTFETSIANLIQSHADDEEKNDDD